MGFDRQACDEWLAAHQGVITVDKLVQFGASRGGVYDRVRRGHFDKILPGVLVSRTYGITRLQHIIGICLAHPAAVIGFTTAGQEWGLRRMHDPRIHVLLPHRCDPSIPNAVVHRTRALPPMDIVHRPNGVRLTSPVRTIFDVADMLGMDGTESVIEQLLNSRQVTLRTIIQTVERLGHPRRPGADTIRAVLWGRPAWQRAVQSDLEHRFRQALRDRGVPEPHPQYRLALSTGEVVHIDLAWPEYRIGAEIDHYHWHVARDRATDDRRRDRRAQAVGWSIVRVTDDDIAGSLGATVEDLVAVLRAAGADIPDLPLHQT